MTARPTSSFQSGSTAFPPGFSSAVATLACQFFVLWAIQRWGWITNYSASGVITAQKIVILGYAFDTPATKYLLTLAVVVVMALLAKNLMRSETGRAFMAVREQDGAASVRGLPLITTNPPSFPTTSLFFRSPAGLPPP